MRNNVFQNMVKKFEEKEAKKTTGNLFTETTEEAKKTRQLLYFGVGVAVVCGFILWQVTKNDIQYKRI